MITDEQARHIAENPDGCDALDLGQLNAYIAHKPWTAARRLWGVRPGFKPVVAVINLQRYLQRAWLARNYRILGKIGDAQMMEASADRYYTRLPEAIRW